MSPFVVGEVVIYWRPGAPFHNTDCTIVTELYEATIYDPMNSPRIAWVHGIDGDFGPLPLPNRGHWASELQYLRKKPGESDAGSWDQSIFKPKCDVVLD